MIQYYKRYLHVSTSEDFARITGIYPRAHAATEYDTKVAV